jgi:RND family efflux transporter MFP subunit
MKKVSFALGLGLVVSISFTLTCLRHATPALIPEAVAAPTPQDDHVTADGRVTTRPNKQVRLGAELAARLSSINVTEGQFVKRGDVLAQFDGREYAALLQEAFGAAREAHIRLRARRDDARRTKQLVESGALTTQEYEHVHEERRAAEARLVASNGAAAHARALLDKLKVVAPIDGIIVSRFVEPSETVAAGAPLFVIADLSERRVEAEVDEYHIGRIALGASVDVTAEGFPGQQWTGLVEEIPEAVGPRRLRPQDPARPTDSAVLAVKISLPPSTPLKLGQRVNVVIKQKGEK